MNNYNNVRPNTLPLFSGATTCTSSFVSYDNIYMYKSLNCHAMIPLERLHSIFSCEILDDRMINIFRHRAIVCKTIVPVAD